MINAGKMNTTFILLSLFLAFISGLFAQEPDTVKKVVINEISINGRTLGKDDYSDIVISQSDSIVFQYQCRTNGDDFEPFIFQVTLKNAQGESNTQTWRHSTHYYKNLAEGDYELIIGAFSKSWKADSTVIDFRVNNKDAEMRQELKKLKAEKSGIDTTSGPVEKPEAEKSEGLDITSIVIGLVVGIGTLSVILLLFTIANKKKSDKKPNNSKGVKYMGSNSKMISNDEIDKIIIENSNLRAEIAALRGQIDAMQVRGQELKKQNNTLKEQVERLSDSQKEVMELQQQKDDLFAVIIHDIKNPAALIKSLVDLLRSYDLTATEQQEVIDDIFETTTKIVALSQEVTRILALEGTTLQLNLQPNDMNEIIRAVHKRNKIAAQDKNIDLLLELQEDIPTSLMDYQKIDEVIDNLVSNAIKFSHKGGQVRVKSTIEENIIYVEVADNGLGLSQEDILKAFQKGTRLSAQPTAGESSSGFGLWIVKKLVEAHGGNVEVKSTIGKGSTFTVEMPYIDTEKATK